MDVMKQNTVWILEFFLRWMGYKYLVMHNKSC